MLTTPVGIGRKKVSVMRYNSYHERMVRVIEARKSELKREQDRGALSKNIVLREYLNGRVLFREDETEDVIAHYGSSGGHLEVALDRMNEMLRGLCNPEVSGLTVGLVRNPNEHTSSIVFVYTRP